MSDTLRFAEDDGTFVAIYRGRSGAWHVGIGDDRAAALRSLADNLDPFAEVSGAFTRACIDGVEQAAAEGREQLRQKHGEDEPR